MTTPTPDNAASATNLDDAITKARSEVDFALCRGPRAMEAREKRLAQIVCLLELAKHDHAATVAALEARISELRADALRYRQLKNGRRQPFGDTFIVKKFNRTFGEEESVSWSDMERELDADIKHANLTGAGAK